MVATKLPMMLAFWASVSSMSSFFLPSEALAKEGFSPSMRIFFVAIFELDFESESELEAVEVLRVFTSFIGASVTVSFFSTEVSFLSSEALVAEECPTNVSLNFLNMCFRAPLFN